VQTYLMRTSWSHSQTTPNKVNNNLESRKSNLIESLPRGNPVPKNQRYGEKNGPENNLVSKNPKYAEDVMKLVNLR